jgi:hypothetical protein
MLLLLVAGVCTSPAACGHAVNSGPAEQHHTGSCWRLSRSFGGRIQLTARRAAGIACDAVAAGWRHISTGAGLQTTLAWAAKGKRAARSMITFTMGYISVMQQHVMVG